MQQRKQSLTSMQQKRPALDERPASPDHSVSSKLGTHGTHACSVLASDATHTRLSLVIAFARLGILLILLVSLAFAFILAFARLGILLILMLSLAFAFAFILAFVLAFADTINLHRRGTAT